MQTFIRNPKGYSIAVDFEAAEITHNIAKKVRDSAM